MFLKFGSKENINDLYKNGTIYMNSREYFRKIEDQELRGDSYEGVYEIRNYGPGKVHIPSTNFSFRYEHIHVPLSFNEVWGNIYCLYAISEQTVPEMFDFKMDERISRFGSHCLVIKEPNWFIESMTYKFKLLNHKFHLGFVDYYEKEKVNGEVDVFSKPNVFSCQKEFRFYVESNSILPITFHIEDLKNYSTIIPTEHALKMELAPTTNT